VYGRFGKEGCEGEKTKMKLTLLPNGKIKFPLSW